MGEGVTYCDGCGEQVFEVDVRKGRAVALAAHTFCPECVTKSAMKPQPARPAARAASRPPSVSPADAFPVKPVAIAAFFLAVGLLGAILLAQNSKREPAPRAAAAPSPLPASVPPAELPVAVPKPAPPAELPAASPKPAPEPPSPPPDPSPRAISPESADGFVGKTVTVEYVVAAVGSSSRSDTVFLNSSARGGKGAFAAVIFKSALPAFQRAFGEDLEAAFKGKRVRVMGEVKTWKDAPEIVLEAPGQVRIVP